MPSEKRARQREARRAKLAAQARSRKRRKFLRNGGIVVVVAAVIVGIVYLTAGRGQSGQQASAKTPATSTSSTPPTTTSSSAPTTSSTAAPTTTTASTAPTQTANAAAQAAADKLATAAGCPSDPSTRVNDQHYSSPPKMTIDPSKTYTATVETTAGTFVITLDAKQAPKTVNNFVFLAQSGFYKCVIFHRVIPGFMDQTGDPTGTGTGGPGYQFADENLPKSYATGDVAMANSGPNTNGSQFFVVVPGGGSALQSKYSLFGHVTSGMDVVEKINAEGNADPSAGGVPPDVTNRMLSVTVHSS